ncbi:MAG: 23S rRNA (adenine(2030)-N(6))-methyltransferase RlmJ [Phenylobacterium sp. RIFCSPHIGHO2_01_FULL_70_10]|nr:MAG: 23S rRNA (adenine(2030)-N(6))-methyltransferase RlmJ [Phenylobacterium sp. RIFCSPHIGHO2_01_FULL_70_10]
MNYRHAFHAGNFADILKHAAILMTLSALQARQPRLTVIDTHAGSGVYDLRGPAARKSNEAQAGVLRLMAGPAPAALEPLKRQVAALNEGGETVLYPGSPRLVADALRPADRYVGFELQPDEHRRLRENLAGRRNLDMRLGDGFAEASARIPTDAGALLLIDPPFEKADDYGRIVETVAAALARSPASTALVWLPLKDLETFDAFLRDLEDAVEAPVLVAETRLRPLDDPMKMNGCAVVLLNPPAGLEAPLADVAAWVSGAGEGGAGRVWRID